MPTFIVQTDHGNLRINAATPAEARHIAENTPPPPAATQGVGAGGHVQNAQGIGERIYRAGDQAGQGAQDAILSQLTRLTPQGLVASPVEDVANIAGLLNSLGIHQAAGVQHGANRVADTINPARHLAQVAHTSPAPANEAERWAYTGGSMLPMAMAPGSIPQRVASVALPTAGAEGGGDLAAYLASQYNNGQPSTGQIDPNAARVAGRMVGGAAGGIASGALGPRPATRLVGAEMQTHTPADIGLARALMERDQRLPTGGIGMMGDEALAAAAPDRAGGVQRLMQAVSTTPRGGARMANQTAGRYGRVRATTLGVADQIAPEPVSPAVTGVAAQTAATDALTNLQNARTAETRPLYDRARFQYPDPEQVAQVQTDLRARGDEDQTGLVGPQLNAVARQIDPTWNIDNLSRFTKYQRDRADIPLGQTDALPRELSGAVGGAAGRLADILRQNPDQAAADARFAQISRDVVDPAMNGPLGDISRTADPQAQGRALYPTAPSEGQPADTVSALQRLAGQNRTSGPALTRSRLVDALNEQGQLLQTGENPMAGARTVTHLAANPEQAATFHAGVQEVAPNAAPVVRDLFDVLRATGSRLNQGSTTAANLQGLGNLDTAGPVLQGIRTILQPRQTATRLGNAMTSARVNRNAEDIINLFSQDPAGFEQDALRARGLTSPGTEGYMTLLKALMAAQAANQQQGGQ